MAEHGPLSGRIDATPAEVWHAEVLAPQFEVELATLLPAYVAIEKALLTEYARMGLLSLAEAAELAGRLHRVEPSRLAADPGANSSDIAFALERLVGGPAPPPAWHVDRSRNDLQACAQLMAARGRVRDAAGALTGLVRTALALADRTADLPMPGYTHLQAAQVVTPGFHLAALAGELLSALRRLLHTDDEMDLCPLGAGAMAGQELAWDRDALTAHLGFRGPQPHALTAVASRGWALAVSADLSVLGVTLSRFATDLMAWGSSAYGFLDLPDELSGISSAMPQKKNFPVLERIRGRTAHLTAAHVDIALGQRNTAYANSVEVGKEASAGLPALFAGLASTVRLLTTVLERLRFQPERMRAACEAEFLGGLTLANRLTLSAGLPWRTAQVVAGRYVTAALDRGLPPAKPDPGLLAAVAADAGHPLADPGALLDGVFDVDAALAAKRSAGSAAPAAVRELLAAQRAELDELASAWAARSARVADALAGLDRALGLDPERSDG
jgi:argininosuccinate lyase